VLELAREEKGIYTGYGRKYSTKFSTVGRLAVDIYFGAG
jgi:hypothetical protein